MVNKTQGNIQNRIQKPDDVALTFLGGLGDEK
jgi:hypothetical protein